MQNATVLTDQLDLAAKSITPKLLLDHISTLASDEFEGRCPGTAGEALTLQYFAAQIAAISAETGVAFQIEQQTVATVEIATKATMSVTISGETQTLDAPRDYVAGSRRMQAQVDVKDSDIIFLGYGITAPEYDWDDFKGVDVSGKTIVVLCGDPILPCSDNPDEVDTSMFRGKELTYYGRWIYKYEIGARTKAAAVFIIHETDRAGYGWDVVTHSFGHSDFELKSACPNERPPIDGWLSLAAATKLFALAGLDLQKLKQAAASKDFVPVALAAIATIKADCTFKEMETQNFVAVLEGSDANLKHECIVYAAHWDHFGIGAEGTISGAVDNASGCAGVLALAKAFASLPQRPPRSVVFFMPTLEERGLLGSRYYVSHPVLKMSDTMAVLNLEMLNLWGLGANFSSVCKGHSSLDQLLTEATARQKRNVVPESEPEKGYLYRSDHLPFMQAGVPALAIFFPCPDFMEQRRSYIKNDYHKVTDKVKSNWNLDGAAADTILMFDVGLRLLETGYRAKWNDMSEFRRL